MELKKTEQNHNFIEVDCQYKDFKGVFPIDGKISLIRFIYKKDVPLRFESLKIGNEFVDWKQTICYLDYKYTIVGLMDLPIDIEFKKGDGLILKQFNEPNHKLEDGTQVNLDNYRNLVEKIQLFYEKNNNEEEPTKNKAADLTDVSNETT